ncbi:MAG: N-acetylneuraminate synthase family protein [Deltaproteobacteria bacterium]|nr:N-acetylneuraminate synthase family protein [Deltaproteobacteria bacterium]
MTPVIIAECCQNHCGDRKYLQEMIHAAAENGATYVKLQAIRSSELTHRERFDTGEIAPDGTVKVIRRPFEDELVRLSKLDLSLDDEAWFVEECRRAGVAPMTTIFTRSAAREVKDLGYEAVKIASYDCGSPPLLRDAARWWSTVVVSTGATFEEEVAVAARELAGKRAVFLHCVTRYPNPLDSCHLRRMNWLRRYSPEVGWSDHTSVSKLGIQASQIALALGADWIERHFTILPEDKTKDGPVSISPAQLAQLRSFASLSRRERMRIVADSIPGWAVALGDARRPLSHEEFLNRDYYRGRFASRVGGRTVYNWEEDTSFRDDK